MVHLLDEARAIPSLQCKVRVWMFGESPGDDGSNS